MCITAVKLTADKSLNDIESDFQNHQGVVTNIDMLAKKISTSQWVQRGFSVCRFAWLICLKTIGSQVIKINKHFVFNYDEVPQNVAIFMFLCARFFGA